MRTVSIFILLLLSSSTSYGALRGDWESAGDEPLPYEPKYEFEYDCQLEVKGKLPYVAFTAFRLKNKEAYWQADHKTKWAWVKLGGDGEETPAPKGHGVKLEGYRVYLELNLAPEKGKDGVVLFVDGRLDWQRVEFSGGPREFHFTRLDSRLGGELNLAVSPVSEPPAREMRAQVVCDKVR